MRRADATHAATRAPLPVTRDGILRRLEEPSLSRQLWLIFIVVAYFCPHLAAQTGEPTIKQSRAPSGVITGRVFTDDGSGAAGVSVQLRAKGISNNTGGTRQFATMTDDDGRFKFTRVPARIYSVVVGTDGAFVQPPEAQEASYRVGDNVTITLVRGGVITGRVTDAAGAPVIGINVQAVPLPDARGRVGWGGRFAQRMTDDRGVYRLFGLAPGSYLVLASGGSVGDLSPYTDNIAIYHPSSTRETATEISVVSGGETTGVDIRYRADAGRTVSGSVVSGAGKNKAPANAQVTLIGRETGLFAGSSFVRGDLNRGGFELRGVADGEYEVQAFEYLSETERKASAPRHVTVKGADVGGLELTLAPLASVTGRVVIDPGAKPCDPKRRAALSEVLLALLPQEPTMRDRVLPENEAAVDAGGAFALTALSPGRWSLTPRLPGESWYVKSIATAPSAPTNGAQSVASKPAAPSDLARGLTLKPGEALSNVVVTLAEGAASVRGKITGAPPGARWRVHLVPAAANAADNLLRYAETATDDKGAFSFHQLAPGKYLLLARSAHAEEPTLPATFDPTERATLRREASAAKQEIALQTCQPLGEQAIKFATK